MRHEVAITALEGEQQAIEHIEAGVIAGVFIARHLVGGDADAVGELRLREMAVLADTAKPIGAGCPRPICGGGHLSQALNMNTKVGVQPDFQILVPALLTIIL